MRIVSISICSCRTGCLPKQRSPLSIGAMMSSRSITKSCALTVCRFCARRRGAALKRTLRSLTHFAAITLRGFPTMRFIWRSRSISAALRGRNGRRISACTERRPWKNTAPSLRPTCGFILTFSIFSTASGMPCASMRAKTASAGSAICPYTSRSTRPTCGQARSFSCSTRKTFP